MTGRILASWIRIRKKFVDPRIWINGAKYQQKTAKKFPQTPNLNYLKKRDFHDF